MLRKGVILGLGVFALAAAGSVAASQRASATLTIDRATCTGCTWRQGWFKGSVEFSATASAAAQVVATIRSAKTKKVITAPRRFSVAAGTFTNTIALSGRPLPGTYRLGLRLAGSSANQAEKSFTVPTPVEGVSDRGYASATRDGRAKRVFHRTHKIFAHFHFLVRPQASKVRFVWRRPDYKVVGTITKRYRDYFWTYVLSKGALLTPGTWYCYVRVSGKTAKALSVRVT